MSELSWTAIFSQLKNPLLLAPMAGVCDPVFRLICKEMGAALTYTEMISAKGLHYQNAKTAEMLTCFDAEKPVAVQLFGSDPAIMAAQARGLEEQLGSALALIDINMGCPARKVIKNGDGSALMARPLVAAEVLRAVVAAVKLPVTVKIRKGYAADEDTAVAFARMAEQCGVAAIAVHGRTAAQLYHGAADRTVVGRVKQAVRVPVIASGDVFERADIDDYLQNYDADAIMLARGARGNPWIFAGTVPTLQERVAVAWRHTRDLHAFNPRELVTMRRHIPWYFKGTPHATAVRRAAGDCATLQDYEVLFEQVLAWR
jgi:nifR3 family TIM-barrel protein